MNERDRAGGEVKGPRKRLVGDALTRAVRQGTGVATTAHLASQLLGLAVLAALYRLLSPEDFGLVSMVLPLVALMQIFTSPGFNVATVQRASIRDDQVSWLFWANLGLCGALAALVVLLGPAMAWFYDRVEVTWIAAALAGTLVLGGLGAQHQALLERRLELIPLAKARLQAQLGGGAAAVFGAWLGWGVWALVTQQYVIAGLFAWLLWRAESWRPDRPRRGRDMAAVVRFGGLFTASSLMFFIAQAADKVLVGWAVGAAALGLYGQAFNLMMKPVYLLTTPLAGVMLPGFSRAVGDQEALSRLVLAFTRIIALVALPAAVGLFLVAPDVMLALGGRDWQAAGPPLRALSLAILVQGFVNMAGSIYTAVGRTGRMFTAASALAICLLTGAVVGLLIGRRWDAPMLGVAWGYSLTILIVAGPYLWLCLRTADVSVMAWIAHVRRPALATGGMAVVLLAVRATTEQTVVLTPAAALVTQVVVGVTAYVIFGRGQIRWLIGQLHQLRTGAGA